MTVWSQANVESISAQVRGAINADPDSPGGTTPDRVKQIVRAAGIRIWGIHDWNHRRVPGTLTVTATDTDIDCPDDFAKLDTRWLLEQDAKQPIRFYEDARQWQRHADEYDSDDTGPPRYALVRTKTSATGYEMEFKLAPIPDDAYTYPYIYLLRDPWSHPTAGSRLDDTASPQWPADFDEGWRLLATAMAYFQFLPGDQRGFETNRGFRSWVKDAVGNLNETMTGGDTEDTIIDGYDDFGHMTSSELGYPVGVAYTDRLTQ